MASIRVETRIEAPVEAVWAHLRDIPSHVEWMADAHAIRMKSSQSEGVGTAFECDTRVGRLRLTDHMEVTEWDPGRAMGVRHVGLVTGTGRFDLRQNIDGTTLSWEERLSFPWWMGGAAGASVARPVLRRLWRGNLARLRKRVEGG
jgi:hypothetical protein